jgi:hypothetical protein
MAKTDTTMDGGQDTNPGDDSALNAAMDQLGKIGKDGSSADNAGGTDGEVEFDLDRLIKEISRFKFGKVMVPSADADEIATIIGKLSDGDADDLCQIFDMIAQDEEAGESPEAESKEEPSGEETDQTQGQ